MSKFKDDRVHFRNSGMKGLNLEMIVIRHDKCVEEALWWLNDNILKQYNDGIMLHINEEQRVNTGL